MAKFLKKPVFVSISPNAEWDDVWLALKLVFQPWRWRNGEVIKQFAEEFKNYIGLKYVFTFDSGRTALFAILKALNIKEGDEILIQAFTCAAAVNPILWLGAKPIYVDIEEDTYNMSPRDLLRKISSRSRAVIVQHTFGLPADLDEILEIARKNNLLVIEDAAHSLGAEYKSQKIGTFGDAAIFSFGRFKIISSVMGGAAGTNNSEIAKKIENFYKNQSYPARSWIFAELFHPILLSIAKPLYNVWNIGKVIVVIAKKLKLISLTVYSEEKSGGRPPFGPSKLPNALAALGLNQLRKIEKFNKHRRALAEIYKNQLYEVQPRKSGLPKILEGAKPVYLYFPIKAESAEAAYKLIGIVRRREGIYLENWPAKKVIGPQGVDLKKLQYKIGSCPVAEGVAPRVIILPTNINTSEKSAHRVVELIKTF